MGKPLHRRQGQKVAKKASTMKCRPIESKANQVKAPVDKHTDPMRKTTPASVLTTPTRNTVSNVLHAIYPYDKPIEFSDFEEKFGVISLYNLGRD
jgi:hypothetical protein